MSAAPLLLLLGLVAGCYDLDKLERGEQGIRLVGRALQPKSPVKAFELALPDTLAGDQQFAAVSFGLIAAAPFLPPDLGSRWTLLRSAEPCAQGDVFLYTRTASGPEDGRIAFAFDVPDVRRGRRGRRRARRRPGAATAMIRVTAPIREGQRWIGFGYAVLFNASFSLPGMPELGTNGHVSILFGQPEVTNNVATYTVGASASECAYLALVSLLPRP